MKQKILKLFLILTLLSFPCSSIFAQEETEEKLIVHEWGTFTALQDEDGNPVGGINTDDEPVPHFVHRLKDGYRLVNAWRDRPGNWYQGVPALHPDVTMRLETPVIYFYPPEGWDYKSTFDVSARFLSGWITEYYPDAQTIAENFPNKLEPATTGLIEWKLLTLGDFPPTPNTDEHVWTTPRQVRASSVKSPEGEVEKYLFYRGVGNLSSLLSVRRDQQIGALNIMGHRDLVGNVEIKNLWLVHVHTNGTVAYETYGPITVDASDQRLIAPSDFNENEFSSENLEALKASMHSALIQEGLFNDEATAMLNTWELSYFKSPGLRLFYTVPRARIDNLLPLEVSVPSTITRVMIGRIEIITPEQRATLKKIAREPLPDLTQVTQAYYDQFKEENYDAEKFTQLEAMSLPEMAKELNTELPPLYQAYLDLGRFKDALLLDEQKRRPSEGLQKFITRELQVWR